VLHLEVGHDPADGGVDHVDGGDVGAVLAVGTLQRRRRTVEHVFRVAHAILCRLELSAERRRVLKLFHAAVLSAMADGAWVRRIAVSRKYVVAFSGSGIFSGCRGGFLSGLCIVFLI